MKKLIYSLLIICSLCSASTFAQSSVKIEPFKLGETLLYEGKYNKAILRGIAIADFNFTVQSASNSPDFLLKSEAKSKGTLIKLLGFKFNQNFQSTVDREKLRILKTVKRDEQDERVRDSEAVFDYRSKKVIYVETNPNDMARPPYRTASPIETDTQDVISAIYTLRRLPLAVGKSLNWRLAIRVWFIKFPSVLPLANCKKAFWGKFGVFASSRKFSATNV